MEDEPLTRLARVVGGLLLQRGRFGHQVLGQMLLSNSTSLEFVGASVVVAASSGSPSVLARTMVRTVAPSLAVYAVARREERRLQRVAEQAHGKRSPFARDAFTGPPKIRSLTPDERATLRTQAAEPEALLAENARLRRRIAELERTTLEGDDEDG